MVYGREKIKPYNDKEEKGAQLLHKAELFVLQEGYD